MAKMTERPPLLAHYRNGNYTVRLYADGRKVKSTPDDFFAAAFADAMDLKITDCCDMGCPMCHENSSPEGTHGDIDAPFLDTLHSGTELAIGGGNPLSHPRLTVLLERMKARGVVCNLTVNEAHFLRHEDFLRDLLQQKLIWGLGISPHVYDARTLAFSAQNPTVVLHLICGLVDAPTVQKLTDKHLKVLLLGYKRRGRGAALYSPQIERKIAWLKENLRALAPSFAVLCFDNLAIEQLALREQISAELFDSRYMGDDGTGSMYVDLVRKEFACSSTSDTRYPLSDDAAAMFRRIQRR